MSNPRGLLNSFRPRFWTNLTKISCPFSFMPFLARSIFTFKARDLSTSGQGVGSPSTIFPQSSPRSETAFQSPDSPTRTATAMSELTVANSPRRSVAESFPAAMFAAMLVSHLGPPYPSLHVHEHVSASKTPSFAQASMPQISHPGYPSSPATPGPVHGGLQTHVFVSLSMTPSLEQSGVTRDDGSNMRSKSASTLPKRSSMRQPLFPRSILMRPLSFHVSPHEFWMSQYFSPLSVSPQPTTMSMWFARLPSPPLQWTSVAPLERSMPPA